MERIKKILHKAQQSVLLSFCVCVGALALTPPGTVILNRASIFYEILSDDSDETTESQQAISNATTVTVGKMYAFDVENTHNLHVAPGVVARFPHRLVNQGNTEDSYRFTFTGSDIAATPESDQSNGLVSSDDPDSEFDTPIVFLDVNSNGRVEADEPILQHTELLSPGEFIDFIVTARVSATLQEGQQEEFRFTVESEQSDKTRSVLDLVTVGSPGKLDITLNTEQSCGVPLFPNDLLSHTVQVSNSGFGAVDSATYNIDGNSRQGVIVEVPVTENTSFTGFDEMTTGTVSGVPLIQLESFAGNEWVNANALEAEDNVVTAGYFFTPELLVDEETAVFTVQYSVNENIQQSNAILTTAIFDADADRLADAVSNSTCNTFSTISALDRGELRFVQPAPALLLTDRSPEFIADEDFVNADRYQLQRSTTDPYATSRDGLYLELTLADLEHPNIRTDSIGNRFVVVELESGVTGDHVSVVLLETSSADVFRSVAPIQLSTLVRSDGGSCPVFGNSAVVTPRIDGENPNCVLQSADNDELQATFGSSEVGFVVSAAASVHDQGVAFNSRTLQPIAGATVQIRIADTGELAKDTTTGVSYSFVSDRDGRYTLPRLLDETAYYIEVIPPVDYLFPSEIPPYRLTDYAVHGISYGKAGVENVEQSGVFFGASINAQNAIDIPLDPEITIPLLSVDKVAHQSSVDIGQSVYYTVSIRNGDDDLTNLRLLDTLPFGFRYVPGSMVMDGEPGSDPQVSENGLEFTIGELPEKSTIELTYAARPTAAAIDGNGINTAYATALTTARRSVDSLAATAKVKVNRSGVFSDRAALFGKLYVDQNCDGLQNHKEWPIGGVRLYLQDGTYAITDADGLYSLYGLAPGRYVVQVDTHTLPKGLDLKLLDVAQLADADSRILNLSDGDFHRADFAAGCPKEHADTIFAELKRRNKAIDASWYLQHAERISSQQLSSGSLNDDLRRNPVSADGDLSNGIVDAPEGFDAGSITGSADLSDDEVGFIDRPAPVDTSGLEKERMLDAKKVVANVTEAQAKEGTWLWPKSNMSLNGRFMAVVRAGIEPTLYVNDKPVDTTHIGERMVNRREKAQVVAWYGVELDSGENTVEVKGKGPFGNERVLATGVFKRPSAGTQMKLEVQSSVIAADGGRSTLPVTISILDENGYPALGVYYITLESSDGHWMEPDIQDKQPGRQIRIENGKRTVYYRSSGVAGEVKIRASTGSFTDNLVINQVAENRPLLVSGFIESGLYFSTEQLGDFNASTDLGRLDESGRFEARAALFVKGTVKDKYNLTLAYDSASDSEKQLLRDIDPTLHYPVHGDASIRGFEAQSRSKLYVRVERDKNSVMWGDFVTDAGADRRDLARLSRTMTGLNAVFNDGANRLRVFAAQEENRNVVEEIPGNGSALLYRLRQYPIVANSETVEIVTRSRENPDLILNSVRLSRFGDYSVDDELGFLSFAASVSTLDADQNPVYIRLSYDVEDGGEEYMVAGARFDRAIGDNLTLGASITRDGHATEGRKLIGVYGDYKIGKQTRLSVSLARSDSTQLGERAMGTARSLSLDHQWSKNSTASTSLTHQWADDGFNNAGSAVSAGRTETRLTHSQRIGDQTSLLLEANQSRSSSLDEKRNTVGASVETTFGEWKTKAGFRHIDKKAAAEDERFVTSVLGASRKFSLLGKSGEVDFEYEQDLGDAERRRIAAGAKLKLREKVTGYSRYELTNNLLGLAGLSGNLEQEAFTIGVESKTLRSTRLYSEYRMRGAFESRDYETASGVRGDYEIKDGLRISPNFEYIERLGSVSGDSISASVGVTDTRNQNSRRLIRLETRHSSETDHYGLRASVTSRLNTDWTGIVSDNFSYQDNTGGDTVKRHSFVAALARRPKYDNQHHMLFMYKLQQESGVTSGVDRTMHILSTHQNLQIDDTTVLSGRVGLKHDTSEFSFNRVNNFALLADARLSFDLSRRLNFDTGVGALSTDGASEVRYSLGLGLNYTLNKNLRLSFAYNVVGFKDEELDAQQYNAKGAHVGLQYKLDEELYKWLE